MRSIFRGRMFMASLAAVSCTATFIRVIICNAALLPVSATSPSAVYLMQSSRRVGLIPDAEMQVLLDTDRDMVLGFSFKAYRSVICLGPDRSYEAHGRQDTRWGETVAVKRGRDQRKRRLHLLLNTTVEGCSCPR